MMDVGPDNKRPRIQPSPNQPWGSEARQLPPPSSQPTSTYTHHSPFPRPLLEQHPLDRRPSDHSQFEHPDRRPNSVPSHSYGHPPPQQQQPPPPTSQLYSRPAPPPAEPMVKRDPSDEPQPPTPQQQLYRPPSGGNGPEHSVNPNIPQPQHEGGARTYNLPPFEPQRPPPQYSTPNSYAPPPPTPMSAGEPYNHPYGTTGLPPPPREGTLYASVSYPTPQQRQQPDVRKKAQRAAQACDSCRTLKAKCDEGRPLCATCKEKGLECRYRDPPPKQQDKASADIMEILSRLEASINARFEKLDQRVTEIQRSLRQSMADPLPKEEVDESVRMPAAGYESRSVGSESQRVPSTTNSPYSAPALPKSTDMSEPFRAMGGEHSEPEEDAGEPGPQKAPSIPVNHTTGAARLLLVGPIKDITKDFLHQNKLRGDKYPLRQEERRGLLRVYGSGEGYEALPGYDRYPLIDYGDNTSPSDTPSNVSSPAAGEEWGQSGGLTPPGSQPEYPRAGISVEGMPDFSSDTVWELVKIYDRNINIMHPIFTPAQLNSLTEKFLRSLPPSYAKPVPAQIILAGQSGYQGPAFVLGGVNHRNPESPGNKRKRSPGHGDYPEAPVNQELKPGHPFRSIGSALVMLVMALGKICQHRGRIPGPVPDEKEYSYYCSSPVIRNGHPPSPLQHSPSISTPVGMASPQDIDHRASYPRSRRTSVEGGGAARSTSGLKRRNLDVIPGLAYFAMATDILGNQMAGNTLAHVHANILAGLYHAQLGRVMESHGYIATACRGIQVTLPSKLGKFREAEKTGRPPKGENGLLFAFWTCLQLESDIIAELPYPHSGILTYEEDMPRPNYEEALESGISPEVIQSYSAQLFLRKHLNSLHNMFYKPEGEGNQFPNSVAKPSDHFPTIEACQENLNTIHSWAPLFAWDAQKGEPASKLLDARLRAKYYGAQVITYRHFVLKILERSSKEGIVYTDEYKANISAPTITGGKELDFKVMEFARNGIKALIHSTKAFHGLGDPGSDRIIVTNIWGTAHAQWGNMLTLSAAYADSTLSKLVLEYICKEELQDLLDKTVKFLNLYSTPKSALTIDTKILQHVGRKVGLIATDGPTTMTSSFSSSSAPDVHMSGQY